MQSYKNKAALRKIENPIPEKSKRRTVTVEAGHVLFSAKDKQEHINFRSIWQYFKYTNTHFLF